jgi:hypothetical protein
MHSPLFPHCRAEAARQVYRPFTERVWQFTISKWDGDEPLTVVDVARAVLALT